MDFDKYNALLNIYNDISNIYKQLYNEEKAGNINSNNFIKLVNILKSKIEEEKKIFNEIKNSDNFEDFKEFIKNEDLPTFVRMKDYISNNEEVIDEDNNCKDELSIKLKKLYKTLAKNIFLMYASFLDEYINNEINNDMKNKLLSWKYYNSYTRHYMEEAIINFNFKIDKDNYVDTFLVSDLLGIEPTICENLMLENYLSILDSLITYILSFNNNEYNDYNKKDDLINFQCMFMGCLSLLSEYEYNIIKDEINEKIDELSTEENEFGVKIINEIMKYRKKYKIRVKKLAMRPLNI